MAASTPPVAPQRLFAPEHLIVDLETALGLSMDSDELQEWLRGRIERGDPGPVHFSGGEAWTEESETERLLEERQVEERQAGEEGG